MRVKAYLASRDMELPMKNVMQDVAAYKELIRGGGRPTVPCLRIENDKGEVQWMYESLDIIDYLAELGS